MGLTRYEGRDVARKEEANKIILADEKNIRLKRWEKFLDLPSMLPD